MDSSTTTTRAGVTQWGCESLSSEVMERARKATFEGRQHAGQPIPTEEQLVERCSTCGPDGWMQAEIPEGGIITGRCRHFLGMLTWLIEREGIPTAVRKPVAVAS